MQRRHQTCKGIVIEKKKKINELFVCVLVSLAWQPWKQQGDLFTQILIEY